MYKVISNGKLKGYADSPVYILLHSNGCYVPCQESEAEGVCVKLPTTVETEDGKTMQVLADTVFALKEGGLYGNEPVATLEWINGAMLLNMLGGAASGNIASDGNRRTGGYGNANKPEQTYGNGGAGASVTNGSNGQPGAAILTYLGK